MRHRVLACDYDGTLAHHGQMTPSTMKALHQVKESGRKLLLVTGRVLDELLEACPALDVFDVCVIENGAVLFDPVTGIDRLLAPTLPDRFVTALQNRGIRPLTVGRAICSTVSASESAVVRTIHELGLDLQIIFNKESVMVLPANVNKGSGLAVALGRLGETAEATVAVGDAENDLVMLGMVGVGVAVANALDSVKERAQLTTQSRYGAGVEELIQALLDDDLADTSLAGHRAG